VTVLTPPANLPDYEQLVKFLFQPFLSAADAIGVDCEYTVDRHRVWIRVAVATPDRDTAFGRGGRNIQAIRTVLQAAATAVGQSIHLDVYGSSSSSRQSDSADSGESRGSGIRPTRTPPPSRRSTDDDGDDPAEKPTPRSNLPPPRRK
jgi:predicted RNA-binding protein YlqC (UPF0109 family)